MPFREVVLPFTKNNFNFAIKIMETIKNIYLQKFNLIRITRFLFLLSFNVLICSNLFAQDNLLKSAGIISEKLSTMKTGINPPPAFTINSTNIICIANNGAQGKTYSVTLNITPNFTGTIMNLNSANPPDLVSNCMIPFPLTGGIQTQYTLNIRTTTTAGNSITLRFIIKKNLLSFHYQDVKITVPECSLCDCAQINPVSNIQLNYYDGTPRTFSINCREPQQITVPASTPFNIVANVNCSPPNCNKILTVRLDRRVGGSSFIYIGTYQTSSTNTLISVALPALATGQYRFIIGSKCGNQTCSFTCTSLINVQACSGCFGWSQNQLFDDENNLITNLTDGMGVPAIEMNRAYKIHARFNCNSGPQNGCPVTYIYSIVPGTGQTGCPATPITGSVTAAYPNPGIIPFTPTCGNVYYIKIKAKCGNTECLEDIFDFAVKIKPRCQCDGRIERRNTAKFDNGSGSTIEREINCNPFTVNTVGPFPRNGNITIRYDIPCTQGCVKNFSWTVKNPSGAVITTTPANYTGGVNPAEFTFSAPAVGYYLVEITSTCGMEECKICAFRVKIEEMPCALIDLGPNDETEICNPEGTVLSLTGFTGNASNVRWYVTTNPSQVPSSSSSNMITVAGTPVTGTTYNTGNLLSNGCSNTVYRYQCVTTNPVCTSDVKTVTVRPRISEIFLQASRNEICHRQEDITLTASTSQLPSQTDCGCNIKWYQVTAGIRTPIGNGFTKIINRSSLTSICPDVKKIYTYEAVFCEGKCNSISKQINITVYSNPITGNITADRDTLCFLDATTLHLNGHCGQNIQWQVSENPMGPFTDIPGATHVNQNTNRLHITTYYRARIRNGACIEVYSDVKEVVVQQPFNISVSYSPNNCGNFLCPDIELEAHVTGPVLDDNTYFEWYYNGNLVQNSRNEQFLTATQAGSYKIIVYNNVRDDFDATCDTIISRSVGVSNFDFLFSGGDCICKNKPATFTVILPQINCNGVTCSWYVNGVLMATDDPVTGASVQRDLNVAEGDEVKAVVEIKNKCSKINTIIVTECQNCP